MEELEAFIDECWYDGDFDQEPLLTGFYDLAVELKETQRLSDVGDLDTETFLRYTIITLCATFEHKTLSLLSETTFSAIFPTLYHTTLEVLNMEDINEEAANRYIKGMLLGALLVHLAPADPLSAKERLTSDYFIPKNDVTWLTNNTHIRKMTLH